MVRTSGLYLMLVLLIVVGCAVPRINVPPGYVKLRDPGPYDLKAVSARGNVIALTAHPNEDKSADLAFWSQAVEHQKVDLDGMRLAGREDIKSAGGLEGVLFNFETGEGEGKVTYLVALFVTPQKIHTIEAGGAAAAIAGDIDKLRTAMLSVR
jgi:hypothetical protein